MTDPAILALVAFTFLLAGLVKGVVGMGLPLVALSLLTATLGLHSAMALILFPSFFTNVWQAAVGGKGLVILRRIWPFLALAVGTVWIGGRVHTWIGVEWLTVLLAILLTTYAIINLAGWRFRIAPEWERPTGPVAGVLNGLATGMTGTNILPGVVYLQAIGLPKDELIQALGIKFTLLTVALALTMHGNGLLNAELGAVSTGAILPAFVGMWIGQRYRASISERMFQRFFFIALLVMGLFIGLQAFPR
ncbi:MAG: hypothetical protein RLZ98_2312 [Pseudomonadota bacterium]|jgi:uncharacterized membrane protein YfcA